MQGERGLAWRQRSNAGNILHVLDFDNRTACDQASSPHKCCAGSVTLHAYLCGFRISGTNPRETTTPRCSGTKRGRLPRQGSGTRSDPQRTINAPAVPWLALPCLLPSLCQPSSIQHDHFSLHTLALYIYTSRMIPARPHKQTMAELKLRRLNEHNSRLKDDLDRPRIRVSEASVS